MEITKNKRYKYTYKCEKCNHNFSSRKNLELHIKNTCNKYEGSIEIVVCNMCNKIYKNKQTFINHKCKNKLENKLENEIKLIDEIKYLKKMMESFRTKLDECKTINNTTNNINNGTINNNITLVSFGNEDYKDIDIMKHFLTMNFDTMFSGMVKEIHYNNDKPEYNNIIIHPKNINKCHIFTDNQWCETKTIEQIENMLTKICKSVKNKYKECLEKITGDNEDYKKILDNYYNYIRDPTKLEIKDNYEEIKDDLNGMTYDEYMNICKKYNNLNCFYYRFLTDYTYCRTNPVCHTDRNIYKYIHKKAIETMAHTIYNECKNNKKSVDGSNIIYKNNMSINYESDDGDGIDRSELAKLMEYY